MAPRYTAQKKRVSYLNGKSTALRSESVDSADSTIGTHCVPDKIAGDVAKRGWVSYLIYFIHFYAICWALRPEALFLAHLK
jgi:hypothetical protein